MTSGEGRPPRRHFNARMSVRFRWLTTPTISQPNVHVNSGFFRSGGARLLGEKVAGEAGKEIAGQLVGKAAKPLAEKGIRFLTGLLAGDAKAATKNITKNDFLE